MVVLAGFLGWVVLRQVRNTELLHDSFHGDTSLEHVAHDDLVLELRFFILNNSILELVETALA